MKRYPVDPATGIVITASVPTLWVSWLYSGLGILWLIPFAVSVLGLMGTEIDPKKGAV